MDRRKAPSSKPSNQRRNAQTRGRSFKTLPAVDEYEVIRRAHEQAKRILIERKGEDDQFRGNQRAELLAMIRAAFRCSPLPRALVLQRRLNVVGAIGGKLQLTTSDADFNASAAAYFKLWARNCEYTDGKCFNELLQLILTSLDTGGDCVIVHDAWDISGGVLCGSNKIRVFESDEIGNLPEDVFQARFPNHTQRSGKIYNAAGRFVGVTVSASQRGQTTFSRDAAITLLRDPDAPTENSPWIYVQDSWRINQGRGVSTFAASVDLIDDYGNILSSESKAANLNATMLGAYVCETEGDEATSDLDDFTIEETSPSESKKAFAVGGEVQELASPDDLGLPEGTEQFPDFIARSRGLFADNLPPGYKFQQYDTKRPNDKVADFLTMLAGNVAATLGLNQTYATLEPKTSYTAFRGGQVLVRPSFVAAQKMLERYVCDWVAARVINDAIAYGFLSPPKGFSAPLNGLDLRLVWSWPRQEEVDALNEQNALTARLRNGATTYREEFGVDWRERIRQVAVEAEEMAKHGLIHPATQTVSGQVSTASSAAAPSSPENKEPEE